MSEKAATCTEEAATCTEEAATEKAVTESDDDDYHTAYTSFDVSEFVAEVSETHTEMADVITKLSRWPVGHFEFVVSTILSKKRAATESGDDDYYTA